MPAFDGYLHVHYAQAYVFSGSEGDTGAIDSCFRGQSNGLLGAAQPGQLILITGLHTGYVQFKDARLINWDRELVCQLPLSPLDYRVRYEGRGMDAGSEADTVLQGEDSVDSYRLSFWPAPAAPDSVVRQTSASARYWHGWAQGL
jgi:hypothetical protein